MVLPAALLLLRRALWMRLVLIALLISLGLCLWGGAVKPIATFFLLPTRAWELLIGSAGALLVAGARAGDRIASSKLVRLLFIPSAFAIVLIPFWPIGGRHPGADAMVTCLATLVVILRRHNGLDKAAITRVLARVGDFSYSLYLVHWPVMSLLKNAWVGPEAELPLAIRFAAVLLSFALAYPLYRFVERPIHRAHFLYTPKLLGKAVAASVALVLIAPVAIQATKVSTDFQAVRRVNFGLGEACESQKLFVAKKECSSTPAPKVLVWGDSYAMHLVPGLLQQPEIGGIVQATRSACGPMLGLGPYRMVNPEPGPVYDRAWAEACIQFNESVLEFLRRNESIMTVVLSSPLSQYVDGDKWKHVLKDAAGLKVQAPTLDFTVHALAKTVREVRAAGRKVVLMAPPPSGDFNIGSCLERQLTGRISLGGSDGCVIPIAMYHHERKGQLALLDAAEKADIPVIRFDPFLCDARSCRTLIDGTMIYRDSGHLSYDGSKLLASRMNWARLLDDRAR